jgi:hypothetical protein
LNGVIESHDEYMDAKKRLIQDFKALLQQEFKHMPSVTINFPGTVSPPAPPSPHTGERNRPAR